MERGTRSAEGGGSAAGRRCHYRVCSTALALARIRVNNHYIHPMLTVLKRLALPVLFLMATWALACIAAENSSAAAGDTNWTAARDHKHMMEQLGIKRLRPGPSGRRGATNEANYDPAKANP